MVMWPFPAELGFGVIIHVQCIGMQVAQVIDVNVVFYDDLPVGLDFIAAAGLFILHQLIRVVRAQMRIHRPKPFRQAGRIGIGVHKQHAAPDIDRGGLQPKAAFVDAARELTLFIRN